jgi:hypothetical protein
VPTTRLPAVLVILSLICASLNCGLFSRRCIWRYPAAVMALDVAARNDTLVVAQGDSGLVFLDISSPTSPRHLQRLAPLSRCNCVAFGGSTVYVGTDEYCYGFSLATGGDFRLVPLGDSARVTALVEDSTLLYVASDDGISIFDVAHSSVPSAVGFVPLAGRPTGLARRDSRLFVSLQDWGVRVCDIGTAEALAVVPETLTLGRHSRAEGVTVTTSGYCIAAQGDSGVVIYYTPTPDTVIPLGGGGSSYPSYSTAATGGLSEVLIYASDSSTITLLKLIERTDSGSITIDGGLGKLDGFTRRICLANNGYVYSASGEAGIYIVGE